jgi:hypothetical protein
MDHGIKVSKQGYNVMDANSVRDNTPRNKTTLPHLLSALALPYLLGAKTQVKRYQLAASSLKERPVIGVYDCLHEASTLFEDLNTVGKYVEKCESKHENHQLWLDVRNHIRHDIREEYDNETNKRKNQRAERLKLDPKLQTNMGFTTEAIKVGGTIIEMSQIIAYIQWAESLITDILNDAKARGHIK